jgi:DNA invertase Pin-like site-specific DNA recombinase
MSFRARRTFGLVRVSGDPFGRADDSLDAQRVKIETHCSSSSLPKPEIVTEVASASRDDIDARPDLRRLLSDLREGDILLVTQQDRLARNTRVYLEIIKRIQARGARFFSLAERFDPDTPEGRFAATIMAATAQHEAERIKDRMVGARKRMRDEGLWVEGLPPIGYRVEKRRLVLVPEDACVVREAARRCIAGESIGRLIDVLPLPHSGRMSKWDKKSIGTILRNRVYVGQFLDSRGAWRHGPHEPILDAATFAAVQTALDGRRNLRGGASDGEPRTDEWLLKGLAWCAACESRMGAVYGRSADYYGCNGRLARRGCLASYLRVDATDEALGAATIERLKELRTELAGPPGERPRLDDTSEARAALVRRRERVLDMYESQTIDRAEMENRLARIDAERERLDVLDAERARETRAASPEVRRGKLKEVREIERVWKNASVPERRAILARLVNRIELQHGEEPRITWKSVEELTADV